MKAKLCPWCGAKLVYDASYAHITTKNDTHTVRVYIEFCEGTENGWCGYYRASEDDTAKGNG